VGTGAQRLRFSPVNIQTKRCEMRQPVRCAGILVALATFAIPMAGLAATRSIQDQIAAQARQYVSQGKADGLSAALVQCGRPMFVAEGMADRQTARKVTPDTVFQVGSISKTLTALLLAYAVAEGRVKLGDDVRDYLPGRYGNLQWSDGTPITLGQLADTTSGLPDYLPDPAPLAQVPADQQVAVASQMLANYSNQDFLSDLHGIELVAKPGSESRHSNVAAQMLGLVMSRVYAQPFGTLLFAKVEQPLGMRSGAEPAPTELATTGYDDKGQTAPAYRGESVNAAGGLEYSARDMARLLAFQIASADPAVETNLRVSFSEGPDRQHAFAWVVSQPRPGVLKYRMSGGTFGASSYIEFYPSLGYGIALMANRAGANVQDELQQMAESAFDAAGAALPGCATSDQG
jgi:serine-type D-Ala-D-Ala carboxypeptidase/endopeptidase